MRTLAILILLSVACAAAAGVAASTVNERIVESAFAMLRGEISAPKRAGMCLALVRIVIEDALGLQPNEWYHVWRTYIVPRGPGESYDPWARDMERSLRNAGMEVALPRGGGPKGDEDRYVILLEDLLRPGDLLFRWDSPQRPGHVGILLPGNLVLENVFNGYRPVGLWSGPTALTPLGSWPITTVIRFNPTL